MKRKAASRQPGTRLKIWLQRHAQVLLSSLGRLVRLPLSTLMTSAVIGIALALPIGLHLLIDNLQQLSGGWEQGAEISLFLKQQIDDEQAAELADKLRRHQRIASIQLIGKTEALNEFRRLSGFGEAIEALDNNPLPVLLVVQPKVEFSDARSAQRLVQELRLLPEAELVQLDLQWVKRLQALARIAQRGVLLLASLLGLAVLLVVGNTIRLEIQHRHAEIEISKLIGATDAFIRRPFLYTGIWYGLFGGSLAWFLVSLSIGLLGGPVAELAGLYQSDFELASLDAGGALLLLAGSAGLGLGGSWLAVARHLSKIEPD
ncbi:MAG: permease-like cell division protein FtsX [Chromatiales bacterium]|jgi:cell division transport system permease protein